MKKNYYNEYLNEVANDAKAELDMFFSTSYESVKAMTTEERDDIQAKCAEIMDNHYQYTDEDYDRAYDLYFLVSAVFSDEYRMENEGKLIAYFNKYFAGKSCEQICAEQEMLETAYNAGKRGDELPDVGDWSWYSDWHKDCYGYRPRIAI